MGRVEIGTSGSKFLFPQESQAGQVYQVQLGIALAGEEVSPFVPWGYCYSTCSFVTLRHILPTSTHHNCLRRSKKCSV